MTLLRFLVAAILMASVFLHIYLLYSNRGARFKRKWFRLFVVSHGIFLLLLTAFLIDDLFLMVFVVPVMAWIVFALLKFTRFCEWCGWPVRRIGFQMPFEGWDSCPRCGARFSQG
jgi:hypothetical protein